MDTTMPAFRPAAPQDLRAIEAIMRAAYSRYIPRIGRPPAPMLDDYASLIAAGRVTVAELDGTVQGVVVLLPQDDAMLLDNVAVAPEAQGHGIGRRLLALAESAAKAAGYDAIRLYTNEAMTENLGLYGRLGYAETHRAEEKGLKRVYMRKQLAPAR